MRETAELATLGLAKARQLRHALRAVREQPLLKIVVLSGAAVLLLGCLYVLFHQGFSFLARREYIDFQPWVLRIVFPIFFLCLGAMIGVSGGVIAYAGLFHAPETSFLQTLPIRATSIFLMKSAEVAVVSSWAFVFLGVPLMVAFAAAAPALPAGFGLITILYFFFFLWIPVGLGMLAAMLLARFLPSRTRLSVATWIVGGGLLVGWLAWRFVHSPWPSGASAELYVQHLFDRFQFGSNPLYPSYWIGRGLLEFAQGSRADGLFYLLLLVSNALFWGWMGYLAAGRFFAEGAARTRARATARHLRFRMLLFRLLRPAGLLLAPPQRVVFEKDLRTFFRDSTQWSQFMIFFGLLGVYFFNLRRLPYNVNEPYWQSLISFLNLAATALTLCTFTSRFVFPLVSLEGRRFWVLGLSPVSRRDLLVGKFVFAFLGAAGVSGLLITISDLQIRVPSWLLWVHLYTTVLVSMGLAGLSVGLGALYPNFKEDNPSKIVSGFGGTLNLVLGLAFICVVIALQAIPTHLWYARGEISHRAYRLFMAGSLLGATLLTAGVTAVTLWRARIAFERMEI